MSFTAYIKDYELIKQITSMFEIVSDIIDNDFIVIDKDCIELKAMDVNKVSLIHLRLDKNLFHTFNFNLAQKVDLGINFKELNKILKLYDKGDEFIFKYYEENDNFDIILNNKIIQNIFSIKLLNMDKINVGELDSIYDINIDMKIDLYKKILKTFESVNNESAEFNINNNQLRIKGSGDNSSINILLDNSKNDKYKFYSCSGNFKNTYAIEFLKKYKKNLTEEINISFSKNLPIKISSSISHHYYNAESKYSFLKYYIAPKIDE